MILFFAGAENKVHGAFLRQAGAKSILESAYYLNYNHKPNKFDFPLYVLDSGGFTARKQGVPVDVTQYAEFLNKWQVRVAFNLDTMDFEETLRNQKYLETNTKTYIIPVYHYTEYASAKYRSLIDSYCASYPYIALGGTAEGATGLTDNKIRFFDYCHSKTRAKTMVHGLAVTSTTAILRYPWYSVDSTTWLSYERYGMRFSFEGGKIKQNMSMRLVKEGKAKFRDISQINENKDEIKKKNIRSFQELEEYATKVWASRGVKWGTFYGSK